MSNACIIKKLESSNSRLFKEEVLLDEMKKENDVFFEGLSLAYNRLLTFGVKKVEESEDDGIGLNFTDFKKIATGWINACKLENCISRIANS